MPLDNFESMRYLLAFLLSILCTLGYGQMSLTAYMDTIMQNYGLKQSAPVSLKQSVGYAWIALADIVGQRPTFNEVDSMIAASGGGAVADIARYEGEIIGDGVAMTFEITIPGAENFLSAFPVLTFNEWTESELPQIVGVKLTGTGVEITAIGASDRALTHTYAVHILLTRF